MDRAYMQKYAIKVCINMLKICNKYAYHMQIYANINMHIYARIMTCKIEICNYMLVYALYTLYVLICRYMQSDKYAKICNKKYA